MNKEIEQDNLEKKTIKGMLWIIIGRGGNVVLQMIVTILLARILDNKAYGVVTASLVSISFCEVFLQYTIPPIIIQRQKLTEEYLANCRTFSLVLGVFLCIVNIIYSFVSEYIWKIEQIDKYVLVLSISFIIQSLTIVEEGCYQRELKFKFLSIRRIIAYVIGYGIIGIGAALCQMGAWALILAYNFQMLVNTIILLLGKKNKLKYKCDMSIIKEIGYQAFGYSLSRLGTFFAQQGDNFMVGRILGAESLGTYGKAYQFYTLPTSYIGEMFEKGLFAALSSQQNNKEILKKQFQKWLGILLITATPISIVLSIFSKEVVLILLGEKWISVIIPFKILSLGISLRIIYKLCEAIIKSCGIIYRKAMIEIIYALSVTAGAAIGAYWGLEGVCIFVLLALLINCVLCYLTCNKILNISAKELVYQNYKYILGTVLFCGGTAIFYHFLTLSNLWIKVCVCCLFMAIAFYLIYIKLFNFSEINSIVALVRQRGRK